MNEIDLFLNLLDVKSAIEIMKVFNLNTKSQNLEYMKIQLRKTLKGQMSGRKNNKVDPFSLIKHKYRNDYLKDFNENEFMQVMVEIESDSFPEYRKFLNYLSHFNKEAILRIDEMNKNFIENKQIFQKKVYLNSEDEIEKYIRKVEKNLSMDKHILSYIARLSLDEDEKKEFIKINENHKNSDILDIYDAFTKEDDDRVKDLLKLSYSLNNYSKDEGVNKLLAKEVIQSMLFRKYKELKNARTEFTKSEKNIGKLKEKNLNLTLENEELKEKSKGISKDLKSLNKDIVKNEQEKELLLKQMEEMKIDSKRELEKLELSHYSEVQTIKNRKLDFTEKFIEINGEKIEEKIGIAAIVSNRYKLTSKIFPEVYILHNDKLNLSKREILKMKINILYIQRQELCSQEINVIDKICRDIGIEVSILEHGTEKGIIEFISCAKNKMIR